MLALTLNQILSRIEDLRVLIGYDQRIDLPDDARCFLDGLRESCEGDADIMRTCQQLRGATYLRDGALTKVHLTEDGRLESPRDRNSLHILVADDVGQPLGTIRLEFFDSQNVDQWLPSLGVWNFIDRNQGELQQHLRVAADAFVRESCRQHPIFIEAAGLAVERQARISEVSLFLSCTGWAVGKLLGSLGGIGVVTTRHQMVNMLRRVGPNLICSPDRATIHDCIYGCKVEVFGMSSTIANQEFQSIIETSARVFKAAQSCVGRSTIQSYSMDPL